VRARNCASPVEELTQRNLHYLRTERVLAENSVLVYEPYARDFLAYRMAKTGSLPPDTLDAETIRTFLAVSSAAPLACLSRRSLIMPTRCGRVTRAP
jgi:hypothetical protein